MRLGQHGDEVGGIVQDAGVIVQEIDEATVAGVFFEVRLLLRDEQTKESLALGCLLSDGGVGLDHLAGETGDLEMIEESVVQGGCTGFGKLDRNLAAEVERVQDLFDEADGRFAG